MRVLFSAHGAYGHVLPLVGVARALEAAGHEVRVATGEELCPAVASVGLRPVRAGMGDETMVAEARRRWPEIAHDPPASWAPRMFTDIAAPAMAADLVEVIASWRPNLVVREEGEYGAPVAAAAAGVTWVTHGWGSPLPSSAELDGVWRRVTPLWCAAGLSPPRAERRCGAAVLDPCPPSLYRGNEANFLVRPVRAVPAELGADGDGWRPPPRLAYVGFGTVPLYRDQPELIAMVVEVLLAAGFGAVVTTPDAELGRQLHALDAERVRVEEWVSLRRLLQSCELVVSHGGAGTVLAALAAGVPLLLLPRGSPSQLRMGRACAERGVARVVGPTRVGRAELDTALADLTADDRFGTAARELAGEIDAMPGPEETAGFLEALVRDPSCTADAPPTTSGGLDAPRRLPARRGR